MIEPFVMGSVLGLFSGLVPGPYSALIAATALHRGFVAAARIASIAFLSEPFVLAVAALVLSQLPETALRWMGIVGGLLLLYLAVRTWRQSGGAEDGEDDDEDAPRRTAEAATLSVVSPTPWVFWLLVGAPVFLGFRHTGWPWALAFAGSFVILLVAVRLGVAGLAAFGGRTLDERWRRRVMRGAAVALVLAGSLLAWQSWSGNFERMVAGSQDIRAFLRGATDGSG